MKFKVGNIVTRDGSDEHIVIEVEEDDFDIIVVKCVKEPVEQWIKLGEEERNLASRYDLVREE